MSVKRATIVGIVTAVTLATVTAVWLWRHSRLAALSPGDLARTVHAPPPPSRLTEGCAKAKQVMSLWTASSSYKRPIKSATPLGPDEIAVYRAVIGQWASHDKAGFNVSDTTFPLDGNCLSHCGCMANVYLEDSSVFYSVHDLDRSILPSRNVRLVNAEEQASQVRANDPGRTIGKERVRDAVEDAFASGLFSMSEIAFDKDHRYAVASYDFWCGSLCGSGSTLIFEKTGGEWKKLDR